MVASYIKYESCFVSALWGVEFWSISQILETFVHAWTSLRLTSEDFNIVCHYYENLVPFSGEFIITMSHLPGRVLNFKIPLCWAILLSVQKKKIEMCGISCHNNTKFLHAIAEVCLYLMHKKWNSYVYLSPTPQLEILRSESRHLYSLHVHYNLLNHLNLFVPP